MRTKKPKKTLIDAYPPATMELDYDPNQQKPCVTCVHNIRIRRGGNPADTVNRCDIDL